MFFRLPFEAEASPHPSLEEICELVVTKKVSYSHKAGASTIIVNIIIIIIASIVIIIRAGPQRPKCQKCYGTNFFHCVYTYK